MLVHGSGVQNTTTPTTKSLRQQYFENGLASLLKAISLLAMITIVDSLVIVLATSSSYWLYKTWILPSSKEPSSDGYIIKNTVQHGRLIPAESAHSFTYPTLSLLLSVQSLDSGSLNLGYGRVFGVGKRPWTRIVGLRPAAYLMDDGIETKSFRSRLDDVLEARGLSKTIIHDVWILTSPSYLGFEGINPLTVWFGYDKELNLKLLVLEVCHVFHLSAPY